MTSLAPVLEAFFTERLINQRRVSPHTIASYRDTFRLLLGFAQQTIGKPPSRLDLADLDAPLIAAFLDHLEQQRHNSVRTRNARLVAVHSLCRYAAVREPGHAALIQRVLAIPQKRFERAEVSFLTRQEIEAVLAVCDRADWIGRRDHTLLTVAFQTGLRVSELTGLHCRDVALGRGPHLRCLGKGRKRAAAGVDQPVSRQDGWVTNWVTIARASAGLPRTCVDTSCRSRQVSMLAWPP
jgi:site-specific recombinase XerD